MRAEQPEAPPAEKSPLVADIVRAELDSIFLTKSSPHNTQVSPAHRDPRALNWIACVKAEVNSAAGKPIGMQTYRIIIVEGKIVDRRRSNDDDNCDSESYQPI
jgi:hypothetical protein